MVKPLNNYSLFSLIIVSLNKLSISENFQNCKLIFL